MKQASDQLSEGQFEEAVETFSASLAVRPKIATALRGRGLAHLQLKQWAQAAADFDAARILIPDDAENWIDLGISLARDDRIYPAIEGFETLLAKQPECARGHLELGMLHLRLGAIPKGREHLKQALTFHPTLEQRRFIEAALHEQDRLDRKRFYRPDFEALHHQQRSTPSPSWIQRLRELFTSR